jgi:hypothetical protein
MPEKLPEECDCEDADLDILTGIETCYVCGTRRYLTSEQLRHREQLQAQWEADYHEMQHQEEMRQLEDQAMEEHLRQHPHG